MDIGTIVRNVETGKEGVVVQDIMDCCSPEEVPVVYDGTDASSGTDAESLTAIGAYDPGVADPEKCGAGAGEKTCKYLSFTANWECQRFSILRNSILFRSMTAKGTPKGIYPKCQEEIQASIASKS